MGHLNKDVDTIDEGAADTLLIPGDQSGGTGAGPEGVAVEAAGAGIHCPDQHKVGWEGQAALGPADGNYLVLQGLAQHLEYGMPEFREFIEEEYPAMAEAYFPRFWPVPTADQAGVGDGVVRRTEGTLPHQGGICRQQTTYAVELGNLQRLLYGHWR